MATETHANKQDCSDDEFLEQIQLATLALELEASAPQVKPSLWQRVKRWLHREPSAEVA